MIVNDIPGMKEQLAEHTRQRAMDKLSQEVKLSEEQKHRQRRMNQTIFAASVVIVGLIVVWLLR